MRAIRFDLNLLIVFETVYRCRNLTRAAEMLNVTQPAVSNALARLRQAFDDPLFVSTPQGMTPTATAEGMISRVREGLGCFNQALQVKQTFDPMVATRVFRVSMSDLTEALLLPKMGEWLQQFAPGVAIESYHTPRGDILNALASRRIDLAIDAVVPNDAQLRQAPLQTERYVCLVRRGHPIAGQPLDLETYLGLGHIHISSRRRGLGLVDAELNRRGLARRIQLRVQHYLVAPLIAQRTDLAVTAPESLLRSVGGVLLKLPFDPGQQTQHCIWHSDSENDPANRWLRETLLGFADQPASDETTSMR